MGDQVHLLLLMRVVSNANTMLVNIIKVALVLLLCCAMATDEASFSGKPTLAKAKEADNFMYVTDDDAVEVIDQDSEDNQELIQQPNDENANAVVEEVEVSSKKNGKKTDERMIKSMKKFYQKWKKKNHKDWSKVKWTPAQVHDAKRTAKAADKAHTAEVVSDYVSEKAEKGEVIRRRKANAIWAKEKQRKAKHKHLSKKKKAKKA